MAEIRPYGSPSFDFNFTLKILQIPDTETSATIQDLWNAIIIAHADLRSMDDDEIATISGKEDLGGGVSVGLTISFINGWRIQAAPRAGPDFVLVTVSGGNTVTSEADQAPAGGPGIPAAATNPIAPANFTNIIISQSSSATGIIAAGGDTDDIVDGVWNAARTDYRVSGSMGEALGDVFAIESGRWEHDKDAGKLILYAEDGTTPLFTFNLLDDLGAANTSGEDIFERVPV